MKSADRFLAQKLFNYLIYPVKCFAETSVADLSANLCAGLVRLAHLSGAI